MQDEDVVGNGLEHEGSALSPIATSIDGGILATPDHAEDRLYLPALTVASLVEALRHQATPVA